MSYRVDGVIVDEESGRALEGLVVRAYDQDLVFDDFLGEARTDASGRFEVTFTEVQFMDLFETRPDVYLRIFDAAGATLLHSTKREVRKNAHLVERFELRIRSGAGAGS
jgi:hypothetical protein